MNKPCNEPLACTVYEFKELGWLVIQIFFLLLIFSAFDKYLCILHILQGLFNVTKAEKRRRHTTTPYPKPNSIRHCNMVG